MAANFYSLLSGKQRHANLNPESISGPSMKLLKRASGLYSRKKLEKSKSIKIRAVLPSLTVFNDTHLYWEQVRSKTKEIADYFWLIKA